jgi:hypothetical protein
MDLKKKIDEIKQNVINRDGDCQDIIDLINDGYDANIDSIKDDDPNIYPMF